MSPRALLVLLLGTACQVPQGNEPGFGGTPEHTSGAATGADQSSSQGASETSGGGGSGELSTSAEHGDDTTPVILDVGNSADIGDGTPAGCKGKIDFLFVISREGVMKDVQARLVDAAPKFIATIQEKFDDFDYHIMVVDTDEEWGYEPCDAECVNAGSCSNPHDYPCNKLDQVGQCDRMLGAGNVFSAGLFAYNEPCSIAGGNRYLTRDEPDLPGTFQCIAQVGGGGRGRIGQALATSVSSQLAGIGGCNGGFLRKDALLMVTLIGSWDDEGEPGSELYSDGTPEEWAQAVIDAKQGHAESVVMLDIGDASLPWQDRIWKLTKMFEYSLVTDGLAPDYGPAFKQATDLVDEACAGFVAPG